MNRKHVVFGGLTAVGGLGALVLGIGLVGCRPTSHPTAPSDLGTPSSTATMEAVLDEPGPVTVETVVGANWAVPRSAVINLEHPKAKAKGLEDGDEPIEVVFHALRHPTRGLFLVDTGVERALRDHPADAAPRGIIVRFMKMETMKVTHDTAGWLAQQPGPPAGVFLTHIHLDHITGMRDVPSTTPVYVGPGETTERHPLNGFVRRSTNAALADKGPLRTWAFAPHAQDAGNDDAFAGVIDVFGDGTVWALWVPGHTEGSIAFAVRTPDGPVLLTGDASHTAWGWENGVEPGTFSADGERSVESLRELQALAKRHPTIDIRLGHQRLPDTRRGS